MNIGWNVRKTTGLFVLALLAGCADQPSLIPQASAVAGVPDVSLRKSTLSAEDLGDLKGQSAAEQRRRLDVVLDAHPDDVATRILRLQAEDRLSDYPGMLADSEIVLRDPSLDGHSRQQVLGCRAEALIEVRRATEAVSVANQAFEIDASNPFASLTRGWALFRSDRTEAESALADIDRALQLDPDLGVGYYRRGTIFESLGKLDRAADDFRHGMILLPNDYSNRLGYGAVLYRAGDFKQALTQFDVAVRLASRDPVVWVWRAQADLALQHFDDAAADDRRAYELGGTGEDLPEGLAWVGDVLRARQDFAGAARQYQRSLALRQNSWIADRLVLMQWHSGDFAQTIKPFRKLATEHDAAPYTALWLFIVQVRADPSTEAAARAELVALAPVHRPHVWPDTLVNLLLGNATLGTALVEADASPTNQLRAGRRCEADYYAAERLLMHGEDTSAKPLFEEAYWVCPSTYVEADAVVAERRLIEARSETR